MHIVYLFNPRSSLLTNCVTKMAQRSEPWFLSVDYQDVFRRFQYIIELALNNKIHSFAMSYDAWPENVPVSTMELIQKSIYHNRGVFLHL